MSTGLAEAIRIEARTDLGPGEVEKLAKEQNNYAAGASEKDLGRQVAAFERTLDKAEKLARVLAKSVEENKSPEADAAVAGVRSLIDMGRAALKGKDAARMAEVTRMIERLAGAK